MNHSTNIKEVLFDFDGVITVETTGSGPITKYLAEAVHIPLEKVMKCYYKRNDKLLLGTLTHQEMWSEFCSGIGVEIEELKKNYKIAMVTDNKVDRIQEILSYYHLDELFDEVVISGAVGSRKSDARIFEYTINQLGVEPEECIFIDNTAANLEAPAQMGIHTLFFDAFHRDTRSFQMVLEQMLSKQ